MPYVPKTMAEVTPSWLEETLQESMGDEATDIKVGPEHCVAPREDMMKLVRQVLQWNDVQNIFIILIGKDVCIKLYEIEELHFQVIALDRCEDEFGLINVVISKGCWERFKSVARGAPAMLMALLFGPQRTGEGILTFSTACWTWREHLALVRLLEAADAQGARTWMAQHIESARLHVRAWHDRMTRAEA